MFLGGVFPHSEMKQAFVFSDMGGLSLSVNLSASHRTCENNLQSKFIAVLIFWIFDSGEKFLIFFQKNFFNQPCLNYTIIYMLTLCCV